MKYFLSCFLVMFLVLSLGCAEKESPPAEKAAVDEAKAATPDPQKIVGRWLRPDGGYILQISDVQDGGALKAAYFNPNPINVAENKWSIKGSELHVYVKFDDRNYPGSYYLLIYNPEVDRLVGSYFQAVQKQTFSVEFVRQN